MTVHSVARPDLAAHEASIRKDFPEIVSRLRETLGAKLVAYLGSVKETRAVHQWADGQRGASASTEQRLRLAFHVAEMIAAVDGPKIIAAWFQGLNPQLGDRSPARLIREGELEEVGPDVLRAARVLFQGG